MTTQTIILKEAELLDLITSAVLDIREQVEVPDEVATGKYGNQPWPNTKYDANQYNDVYVAYGSRRYPQKLQADYNNVVATDGYLGYPDVSKKQGAGVASRFTSSCCVHIPFVDFYEFMVDGYDNNGKPSEYPIIWDSDREGGSRTGDVQGFGLWHNENESSRDALRRAGTSGLVTWRYKNQGIIDAINKQYAHLTLIEKDYLVVERWAQATKGRWIKNWDPPTIFERMGNVVDACKNNPAQCVEYIADIISIVALFFGPWGWVASAAFGLVSITSQYIQGKTGSATLFLALEIVGIGSIVKHFTNTAKFARAFKLKEIDAAIRYFANPSVDVLKTLTKNEVKIVDAMLKNGKSWTKTMLNATAQQEKVSKILKNVKDLKDFRSLATSAAGVEAGIGKLTYAEFKVMREEFYEQMLETNKIINGLKTAGKYSLVLGPMFAGFYVFSNILDKYFFKLSVNGTKDEITSARLGTDVNYDIEKILKPEDPYKYYGCRSSDFPFAQSIECCGEYQSEDVECDRTLRNTYVDALPNAENTGDSDWDWKNNILLLLSYWYDSRTYPSLPNLKRGELSDKDSLRITGGEEWVYEYPYKVESPMGSGGVLNKTNSWSIDELPDTSDSNYTDCRIDNTDNVGDVQKFLKAKKIDVDITWKAGDDTAKAVGEYLGYSNVQDVKGLISHLKTLGHGKIVKGNNPGTWGPKTNELISSLLVAKCARTVDTKSASYDFYKFGEDSCVGVEMGESPNPKGGWRPNLNCIPGYALTPGDQTEKTEMLQAFIDGINEGKIDSVTDLNRMDLLNSVPEEDKLVIVEAIEAYKADPSFGLD